MNRNRIAATIIATTALAGSFIGTAQAADATTCDGTLKTSRISGDVVVPAGKTCTLGRATVRGDITLEEDSTLNLTGTTVRGNIGFRTADSNPWNQPLRTLNLTGARVQGTTSMSPRTQFTVSNSRLGHVTQAFFVHTSPTGTIEGSTLDSISYAGALKLNRSTVRGAFESRYGMQLEVNNTSLRGPATLVTSGGITTCGSTYSQDASLDASYQVSVGKAAECAGNRFRGKPGRQGAHADRGLPQRRQWSHDESQRGRHDAHQGHREPVPGRRRGHPGLAVLTAEGGCCVVRR